MRKFSAYIGSQFGNPRGIVGKICCMCMNIINRAMYKRMEQEAPEQGEILEIGYGNGKLIRKLSKNEQVGIVGIDISQDMLKTASQRNKTAIAEGRVRLELGDSCDLSAYPTGLFDAVMSINTIYFWKDIPQGLREIHRVLEDGGVFLNAIYDKSWLNRLSYTREGFHLLENEAYLEMGKVAGFKTVEIVPITKGKSFLFRFTK